ncbi:MAG: hypothetical protein ACE5FA_04650 [Dehalococcoidia bacterium]
MKFKTGVLVGLAVGYVLGAKAGRERYDEIMGACRSMCGDPRVKDLAGRAKAAADLAGAVVGTGLQGASEKIRHRAVDDQDPK